MRHSDALVRPALLAVPGFARLWVAGAVSNTTLWLELLAAGLFTLQETGSPFAVALVSACRALPLLPGGLLVGVLAEAMDRRRIVLGGLLLAASASGAVALLAAFHLARPWHLAAAALVSGAVYATEYPARRRLVVECAGPERLSRAVALDSLTGFFARVAGPVLGGAAFGAVGLAGTFALSACVSLAGAVLVGGLPAAEAPRRAGRPDVRGDLRGALVFTRRSRGLLALLGVTVTMNLCGYAYTALVAPIGRGTFHLTPTGVGVLAAAEPAGAFLSGLLMTVGPFPRRPLRGLAGGAGALFLALAVASWVPPLWPVCAVLLAGGLGSGLYTNCQTAVAMTAPPALRSRIMGLLTTCIGCWPLGQVLVGLLSLWLPPLAALTALGLCGGALLAAVLGVLATRR